MVFSLLVVVVAATIISSLSLPVTALLTASCGACGAGVNLELSLLVSDISLTAFGKSSPNSKPVTGFDGLQRRL